METNNEVPPEGNAIAKQRDKRGSRRVYPRVPSISVSLTKDLDQALGGWASVSGLTKSMIAALMLEQLTGSESFRSAMQVIIKAISENRDLRRIDLTTKITPELPPLVGEKSETSAV